MQLQHNVLKQFPWSPDGHSVEILNPGNERDFGAAATGLANEGYISVDTAPDIVTSTAPVVASTPPPIHPLDHDGDGKPGGSLPRSRKRK